MSNDFFKSDYEGAKPRFGGPKASLQAQSLMFSFQRLFLRDEILLVMGHRLVFRIRPAILRAQSLMLSIQRPIFRVQSLRFWYQSIM